MSNAPTCMLDSNVFNWVLDGKINLASLPQSDFIVIEIQRAELDACRNQDRRTALLQKFIEVAPKIVLGSAFAFDIEGAGFGQACWADQETIALFEKMKQRLQELDRKKGENRFKNQIKDVLIALTAIMHEATLVSADENLLLVTKEFGGEVHALFDLRKTP